MERAIQNISISRVKTPDMFDLFVTLLESIHGLAFIVDTQGTILNANKSAIQALNTQKDVVGTCILDSLPTDLAELRKRDIEQAVRTNTTVHFEDKRHERYFSHFLYPLCDEDGRVVKVAIIILDITDREKAKEDLKISQDNYLGLVEYTNVGICTIDALGKLTYVNQALCKMVGHSEEKMLGRSLFDFIISEDVVEISTLIRCTLIQTRNSPCIEFRLIHKQNRVVPIEANFTAIKENNKIVGFNSIITDISNRKHIESELHTYQKELRSLASKLSLAEEHERRRIAVEIHDNISQTMAICRMKLGALLQEAPTTVFVQQLEEILGLHKQLIDQVRSLSFELSPPLLYEIGLEAAVEKLCERIQKQHGIICSFEDDGEIQPLDEDIRILLFQMIRELLTNVIKHARAHYARVCFKKNENELGIIVEDDGVGFDSSKNDSRSENNGFGLFSIRERLHYVGGHIEITLKRSGGTRVNITIPLKKRTVKES